MFHLNFAKANASCEFQIGLFADNGIWPSLAFFYWHRICPTQMYELVRVAHKTGQNRVIICAPELSFSDCIVVVQGSIGQLLQSKKKRSTIVQNNTEAKTTYRLMTLRTILLGPYSIFDDIM